MFFFFIHRYLKLQNENELSISLAMGAGALLTVPFLWNSETLVDYCGHNNLLITAFTFYIFR